MQGRFQRRYSQRVLCGSEVPDGSIVPPCFDHRVQRDRVVASARRLATATDTDRASTLKRATELQRTSTPAALAGSPSSRPAPPQNGVTSSWAKLTLTGPVKQLRARYTGPHHSLRHNPMTKTDQMIAVRIELRSRGCIRPWSRPDLSNSTALSGRPLLALGWRYCAHLPSVEPKFVILWPIPGNGERHAESS